MIELADAFVALPGGIGTLDELLEVMAWRQLGCIDKPVALLNTGGYFAPALRALDHAIAEQFVDAAERDRLLVADSLTDLLATLDTLLPAGADA